MQNQSSSSYFNRIMSQTPQSNQRRQHRKNSQKSTFLKQRKQSIHEFNQQFLDDTSQRGRDQSDNNISMTKKKTSNQMSNDDRPRNKPRILSIKEQQEIKQKMEQDQRREYLASKVTPVINKILVKIVNQKPQNVLDFMIKFLKSQEGQFQQKRFNTKAHNDTILQDKNMEEVFDGTVAAKFLNFKK